MCLYLREVGSVNMSSYKEAIDLVVCSYCGKVLETRDDREPIYRITKGYLNFYYACFKCTETHKKKGD